MSKISNKYFATKDNFGFSVIYQDYSDEVGNFWALEKDGFINEEEALNYANELNKGE